MSTDSSSIMRMASDIPISHIETQHILRRCYDKDHGLETGTYGIEMCDADNPAMYSLYEYWAKVYRRERIKEHYDLSFDEFLARPRYKINILLEAVREINDKDSETAKKTISLVDGMLEDKKGKR